MSLKLQSHTEHAIWILLHLHEHKGGRQTVAEIAEAIGIPPPQVSRTVVRLRRAKMVYAQHGQYGGYYLNRPLHLISLYDVVCAVGEEPQIRASLQPAFPEKAHGILGELQDDIVAILSETAITEFV